MECHPRAIERRKLSEECANAVATFSGGGGSPVHGSSKSFPSSYSPIRLIPEHGKPSRQKPGRAWVEISQVIRARPDAHGAFLEVLLRVLCVCGCVAFLLTSSSLSGRYCIKSAVSRNNLDFSSSSTEQRKSVRGAVCPAAIQFRRVISSLESSIVFAASLSAMTLRYTQPNLSIPFHLSTFLPLSFSLSRKWKFASTQCQRQSIPALKLESNPSVCYSDSDIYSM